MNTLNSDYATVLTLVLKLTGLSEHELLYTRVYPRPYYRAMIAEYLHNKGYSLNSIGNLMHKNHATLIHCIKQLQNIKSVPFDKDLLTTYKRFSALVDNTTIPQLYGCVWNVTKAERHCELCNALLCSEREALRRGDGGVKEHKYYTTSDSRIFTELQEAEEWEDILNNI